MAFSKWMIFKWLAGIGIFFCAIIVVIMTITNPQLGGIPTERFTPEEKGDTQPLAIASGAALDYSSDIKVIAEADHDYASNHISRVTESRKGDFIPPERSSEGFPERFSSEPEYVYQDTFYFIPDFHNDDQMEESVCCDQQPVSLLPCGAFSLDTCQFIFGAAFGDYIGLKRGYAELGVFTSFALDHLHTFVDARAFHLHDGQWAGTLGVGIRGPLCGCDCCSLFGANIYYDYLDSFFDGNLVCANRGTQYRSFNRIGLGLEYLSPCFDARINSYIPIGRSVISGPFAFLTVSDTDNAVVQQRQLLRWGVDAELGRTLFWYDCLSSYLAIGGYYYNHRELESIYGPTVRFETAWKQYLILQVSYSYDHEFHSRVQGKILFSIPLEDLFNCFCGCFCECPCVSSCNRLVRRNFVPFVDEECCWEWNW